MSREVHVRFWESAGVRLPRATQLAVADRRPIEAHELLAVRGSWKMDLIGGELQQHLACTAQLAKAGEDLSNHFLQSRVWIEA